ncbi:peroxiredoxin [Roseivivax sp. CAU 1761]
MLASDDPAPDFTLPVTGGGTVTLSQLRPSPVVLFFYPRDATSGCTTENRDFTRLAPEFEALGVRVFGISADRIESHDKFMARQELTVPLLADTEAETCTAYGVWAEKKMYGKTFMGIQRATFLIDGEGRVRKVWPKVKVPGHAEEVLEAARELQA